jgi:hypothetical protein
MRIYFDSCLVIYVVEENPAFAPLVESHLANFPSFNRFTSQVRRVLDER